ncbi:unnamed protein product, partial [Linum tenue]
LSSPSSTQHLPPHLLHPLRRSSTRVRPPPQPFPAPQRSSFPVLAPRPLLGVAVLARRVVEGEAPGGVAEALRFVDDAVFSFLLLLLVSGATTALGFFHIHRRLMGEEGK